MSPRQADPAVRTALIEHAARLIAEEGNQALTLRRLTRAVGVSTMAVYTYFGGMDELRLAIREEGFTRLAARMDQVESTDDPVADLVVLGRAYYDSGVSDPHLYRAMFMEDCGDADPPGVGLETFDRLVAAVARCIDAGRFAPAEPRELALQMWAMAHGIVALLLAGHLTGPDADRCLAAMGGNLITSFGDDPGALRTSTVAAVGRMPPPHQARVSAGQG